MDVSVIIVNYNTLDVTKNCIDSIIKKSKEIEYEIILVDNASSDGSCEYFRDIADIIFVSSNKNVGFGRANNLGYKYATGKYIFLLNSDTILLNNAVRCFYDEMEKVPSDVACLGTKLRGIDGVAFNHSYGVFPSIKGMTNSLCGIYLPFIKNNSSMLKNKDSFCVDYITGADLFVKRGVIDELGLFDPDFFMYFEETEMQYRYFKAGYKSKIISTPMIIHLENASDSIAKKKYSFNSRIMYFRSMFIYMRKRYGLVLYFFSRLICLAYYPLFVFSDFTLSEKLKLAKVFIKPVNIKK